MTGMLVVGCLAFSLSPRDSWAQTPATQTQQAQPSQTQPPQDADIPDAPMVQPSATPPEPPPIPKPEEKKPSTADRNPWTNQPNAKPADTGSSTAAPGDQPATPPPMPPVRTVPPGTSTKASGAQEQLYTYVVHPTFVQLPVTVKDRDGRRVDGLLPTDFTVKENGTVQKLSFFTQDPFALSVAIVLDLGMPELDGFAVARRLRTDPRTAHAHVHCLTGRTDPASRRQAEEAGCELFLTKPVDARGVAEFFRQVRQHRCDDPGVDRRGGAVIEIDFSH